MDYCKQMSKVDSITLLVKSIYFYILIYLAVLGLFAAYRSLVAAHGNLLFGRKAITNLDSVLKSRDITLLTKVCLVKTSSHVWM